MTNAKSTTALPARGPADHTVRDQIIEAAHDYFAHYGYTKTTVADLARKIGFSKAYIYRFFESKQAIGEAICADTTGKLYRQVLAAVEGGNSATEKMRIFTAEITEAGVSLLFNERKLHEIAAHAANEGWAPTAVYTGRLQDLIGRIILEGRESGEFERKTPLDETVRAIYYAMLPFVHPLFLEKNLDLLPNAPVEITNLILRSLAP
jgi:AcrR family transcriptional regulator